MAVYSIKELEQLSNVKAHTIRIWEQRYNMFTPERTDTNIRLYNDEQLKKLLNVCVLMNNGMKVSAISKLSNKQIGVEIDKYIQSSLQNEHQDETIINQMIITISNFDEAQFEKLFSNAVLRFGLLNTYVKIVYPMLVRMGLLWSKSDVIPAQEHFLSNLIKQKLFAAIDALPLPAKPDQTWVLFLTEEEEHELGLLFSNYLIRQSGKKVIYLGQRVPYDNLATVVQKNKPTHLFTFIVKKPSGNFLEEFIKKFTKDFKGLTLCISGSEHKDFSKYKQVEMVKDVHSLLGIMDPKMFNK
jgi:DNA-binding transcriptional MerR regulator